MADISAKDVAALRKATGAGMMDCKRALEESRRRPRGREGLAAQEGPRRRGRSVTTAAADQGAVEVVVDGGVGAVVELNCETDFVAKGSEFKAAVANARRPGGRERRRRHRSGQAFEGSTVGETITQLGSTLGERIELGRVARYETADGILDGYKHVQNDRGTIGVLVELGGVDPCERGGPRRGPRHRPAHRERGAPVRQPRTTCPPTRSRRSASCSTELTRNEGKPENAIEKIVAGRLNGFYKDYCLLEQGFVKEPKTTIAKLVDGLGGGATVRRFARIKIGEE